MDYPLGHTSGKPDDPDDQMAIMAAALNAAAAIEEPGTIIDLAHQWRADDVWKDYVMRPKPKREEETQDDPENAGDGHEDDRVERYDTPQYQTAADAEAAAQPCSTCVFLEESA